MQVSLAKPEAVDPSSPSRLLNPFARRKLWHSHQTTAHVRNPAPAHALELAHTHAAADAAAAAAAAAGTNKIALGRGREPAFTTLLALPSF